MGVALNIKKSDPIKTNRAPKVDSRRREQPEKDPFVKEESPETPASIGNNRSILVADDNPVVLKAFEMKLKASGFNVTTTNRGATVASSAEMAKAELIILDVNFAEHSSVDWNGFSVMQWLARFPELATIPVILISGGNAEQYREKALAAGAIAFLQKPINYQELLSVILNALNKPLSQ